MKEIERYNLLTGLIQVDLKNGKYIEHSDYLKEVEQLQARIKELESQSHINEIKAQGIEEAINDANHEMHEIFDNEFHVSLHVANLRIFIDRLRTKHD